MRIAPLRDPVTVVFDGEPLLAERGEPLAASLVGSDKLLIARSPKYHRPRGLACFRGGCDGCLARVDGRPNVMTCLHPAAEGATIATQNRMGTRETDLLELTDWFFPGGLNHHELFAGVPGLSDAMLAFARRITGLGRLPVTSAPVQSATRRSVDVMIVGAGPFGMTAASALVRSGRSVEVVDDALHAGGSLNALGAEAGAFDSIRAQFDAHVAKGLVRLRTRTVAAGIYGSDLLVVGQSGAEVVQARATVLACGAHDGAVAFEGNDLPGIMSARAAGILLGLGVVPGRRIAVVVTDGGGPFGDAYVRSLERANIAVDQRPEVQRVYGDPLRARGSGRVHSVTVRSGASEKELLADLLVVDGPRAPAYELAEQAGCSIAFTAAGYRVTGGTASVFPLGEIAGSALDVGAIEREVERTVRDMA